MKRKISVMAALIAVSLGCQATIVDLSANNRPEEKLGVPYPKSPVRPPVVDLTGYTLTFGHAYGYDVPVELLNEEGEVVHTDCLAAGQTTLSLPLSLTGAYILRLTVGNYYFIGEIEL